MFVIYFMILPSVVLLNYVISAAAELENESYIEPSFLTGKLPLILLPLPLCFLFLLPFLTALSPSYAAFYFAFTAFSSPTLDARSQIHPCWYPMD